MKLSLLVTLYTATLAAAVNVQISRMANCRHAAAACRNLAANTCCAFGAANSRIKSAKFTGLPNTAFGAILDTRGRQPCSKVVIRERGSGCLSGSGKGAGYQRSNAAEAGITEQSFEATWSCKGKQIADVAVFDGVEFDMGDLVPAEDIAEFDWLITANASYEDVPEHLKRYELV